VVSCGIRRNSSCEDEGKQQERFEIVQTRVSTEMFFSLVVEGMRGVRAGASLHLAGRPRRPSPHKIFPIAGQRFQIASSGVASSRLRVYECDGWVVICSVSPTSTIFPRYMTAMRVER
jgi:hypothetical protein